MFDQYTRIVSDYKAGIAFVLEEFTGIKHLNFGELSTLELEEKARKLLRDTKYKKLVRDDLAIYVCYASKALEVLYYEALKADNVEIMAMTSEKKKEIDCLKKVVK